MKSRQVRQKAKLTPDKPLTPKEQRFVNATILGASGSEALERAGYNCTTNHAYRALGTKLRNKPNVAAEIARRTAIAMRDADLTVTDMLRELKALVLSNMGDYLEDGGTGRSQFKDPRALTREQLAAVSELMIVGEGKKQRIHIKLYDKHAALVTLGRHLKMFMDTKEPASVTNNTVVVVQNALSATERILQRMLDAAEAGRDAPALQDRSVLPLEVHPSQG